MSLALWQKLATPACEELISAAKNVDPADVRSVSLLRKLCDDPELIRLSLQLSKARAKAVSKCSQELAGVLWGDPQGVEMASSICAAKYKAKRLKAFADSEIAVLDLCCGIGVDAIGFQREGLNTLCVDIDPVRAWMAQMNTGWASVCTDVSSPGLPIGPFHVDPARRSTDNARRSWSLKELSPGLETIRSIIDARQAHPGVIKLGPGVNYQELEESKLSGEIEILSEQGRLTQSLLWVNAKCGTQRRATLLDDGVHSFVGEPCRPVQTAGEGIKVLGYIYEPDDSIERAELLGAFGESIGFPMLHPSLGLYTSDKRIHHALLTGFEVLNFDRWNPKRVQETLGGLDAGEVEVKTRGKAVDTDEWQMRLKGKGTRRLTVFVHAHSGGMTCIITERMKHMHTDEMPVLLKP